MTTNPAPAPVPVSFGDYLRSFGPGLVVVLTWLGAGDVVDMAIAGGSYGYSLMWLLVLAVVMRSLFVSRIALYQLCNQHKEGVLDGLVRLHPLYGPSLLIAAVVMGHVDCAYMTVGCGEVLRNVFGIGQTWHWALLCNAGAIALVLRPSYVALEVVFKIFLALLSISFIGSAVWVGFNPAGVLRGLFAFEMPAQQGAAFSPLLVAVAMIGAVGGSLMNLVYPYFLAGKGWNGPEYRRVQTYDFILAMIVMIVLNLSVWTLGAEVLFPDKHIKTLDDLPLLISGVLGEGGRVLFYVGIFAAIYTSLVGHAAGLGSIGAHAHYRIRNRTTAAPLQFQGSATYRNIALWCLISSLVWTVPGMPGFVTLTLAANTMKVIILPLLAGGIWWITASERFIGRKHRNSVFDNLLMAVLFLLACYGAYVSARALAGMVTG
jgi:Mn2+/Fe2+ NRAMP family transporter